MDYRSAFFKLFVVICLQGENLKQNIRLQYKYKKIVRHYNRIKTKILSRSTW